MTTLSSPRARLRRRRVHAGDWDRPTRGPIAVTVSVIGELLITAGLVVLLFVVYELWITGIYTAQAQHHEEAEFHKVLLAPTLPGVNYAKVSLGTGFAVIRAPVIGAHWHWVVGEGVRTQDLAKGPGHIPGTALPGAIGNMVISGHRTTHGAPFYNANELQPGDAIILETKTTWYVYRVTSQSVVQPSDYAVTYPVPDRPGVPATQRLITLTTCNPRYSARQRLIIQGVLTAESPTSGPAPGALQTGRA